MPIDHILPPQPSCHGYLRSSRNCFPIWCVRYCGSNLLFDLISCIALVHFIRHDHHPQQEHTPHKREGKCSLPALTYSSLALCPIPTIFSIYSQILCCSNHANVLIDAPVWVTELTYVLQLLFTLPVGPQSSIEMTMRPTSQRTKRMKEPRMTIPGIRDRWEMR
jgi:hypothetical protein